MRATVRAAAATALLLGPTALAFFSGAFFERPRLIAAVVVWALVLVGAVVSPRPLPRGAAGRTAVLGLVLLAGWTALSTGWAPSGERALEDTQRLVLYAGTLLAGVSLLRGPVARIWVEPGLALGTVAVTAYGLGDRLLPGLLGYRHSQAAVGRLEQPLTYWNAQGCLAAIAFVLCTRLAADPARPRAVRAAAGAATPLVATAVYLSLSRGALLALAAGLGTLILLAPYRRNLMAVGGANVLLGAAASFVSSRLPEVEALAAGQTGDPGQGAAMLTTLVVAGVAAGLIAFRAPVAERGAAPGLPAPLARRSGAVAALTVAVAIGAMAGVAAFETTPETRPDDRVGASRFRSADSLRYSYWETAIDAFGRHPVAGTGSGGFAVEWRRRPNRPEPAVDAHSLYIETLSELGLVGGALLAMFLGGVGLATARLHSRDAALAAGPAAVMAVWLVHVGLDWGWEVPALTGVALILAAATVAWQDEAAP